ncbi:MAG: hypothetical protein HQK60_12750 [Deltaproteobacteria bacterium]|nr:hypothetical protein [Deltaproteobacteria bacterium]
MNMSRISSVRSLFLVLALTLFAGCGSDSNTTAPLNANNLNLIFVVSPDLVYNAPGDVNLNTANLTSQGLQRSLQMATFLKQQVLGAKNVTRICALEPMTHLQTINNYPDMAAITYIQQFALLNQITLPLTTTKGEPPYPGNSYPLSVSYAPGDVPVGVATPLPSMPCPECQGLVFSDDKGTNLNLVAGIIKANTPGFYVFSAPWETISRLLADINKLKGYNLTLPATYPGANHVYAISITPSGSAGLITFDSKLDPPDTYPVLPPPPIHSAPCPSATSTPALFTITRTDGVNGAKVPLGTNTNETIYLIRHADAHPVEYFEDGNYVGAGEWRALALPNALRGKISPSQVYSVDPAQVVPASYDPSGPFWSYVRTSLTIAPYAIANNLPYNLVSSLLLFTVDSPQQTSNFFFTGGQFSHQTVLVAWESQHIPLIANALLSSYGGTGPMVPAWVHSDYDSIVTVTLDGQGNVTITNALCEGIDSVPLPAEAPLF